MVGTPRIRFIAGTVLGLGLFAGVTARGTGRPQQPATPPAASAPSGVPVEAPGFVGKTALLETTGYSIGRRIFAPGSHNATWHMHAAGQLVFAESGRLHSRQHDALARFDAERELHDDVRHHGRRPDLARRAADRGRIPREEMKRPFAPDHFLFCFGTALWLSMFSSA